MNRMDEIIDLLRQKDFQKYLYSWENLSDEKKSNVLSEFNLNHQDIEFARTLLLSLDFKECEQTEDDVDNSLEETIWKIAEREKKLTPSQNKLRKIVTTFSRIAAILLLPLLVYTIFFRNNITVPEIEPQMLTVISQPGTVTKLILPDSTETFLNAGSSITYPSYFEGNERKVSISGEAYFNVVKNKDMPMVVHTNDLNVKVYGTSFNVTAFPAENYTKVTLVEGSIALSLHGKRINGSNEYKMVPGQTITYAEVASKLAVEFKDPLLYTSWKDGKLIFRNTTFESVLEQLARKYNVQIVLKDNSLASIPMDATFTNETVDDILRLLSYGTPFMYSYEKPQKLSDGTFTKSKIYIEKRTN